MGDTAAPLPPGASEYSDAHSQQQSVAANEFSRQALASADDGTEEPASEGLEEVSGPEDDADVQAHTEPATSHSAELPEDRAGRSDADADADVSAKAAVVSRSDDHEELNKKNDDSHKKSQDPVKDTDVTQDEETDAKTTPVEGELGMDTEAREGPIEATQSTTGINPEETAGSSTVSDAVSPQSPRSETPQSSTGDVSQPGSPPVSATSATPSISVSAPENEANDVSSTNNRTVHFFRARSSSRIINTSIALEHTTVNGAQSRPALLLVQNAFKRIKTSKDARRIPALEKATARALKHFEDSPGQLPPPAVILEPLRLVCVPPGTSNELKEVAVDTLGQLFSLNYFGNTATSQDENQLLSEAVEIVCDAWEAEGAEQRVEVQIIKALTSAVVNEDVVVHGAVLMRAVRQVYHIFVVTRSQSNQSLAQVSLTQMVQAVFERVKAKCMHDGESVPERVPDGATGGALTLEEMQNAPIPDMDEESEERSENEQTTQDAGLLFRTLCRLSMKQLDDDDIKGQPMRSKLLSLHLLHTIMRHHISVFKAQGVIVRTSRTAYEPFALAVKPYLRQTLAQSALSPHPAVFEITAEIFWLVLANLRSDFKPELAVLFTEVYFPAIEIRTATLHQKLYFMTLVSRICTDPRLLVELYLNYDCDPAAPNVFECLVEFTSRQALKAAPEPEHFPSKMSIDRQRIRLYDLNAPPAVAIARLMAPKTAPQAREDGSLYQLKVAALESVVNVLRSLVMWSQREGGRRGTESRSASAANLVAGGAGEHENVVEGVDVASADLSVSVPEHDDPERFAERKLTKKILDMAVQDFNFSPSKGLRRFHEAGLLGDIEDPDQVAKLLISVEGLDKARLGEFLGKSSEFHQKTMASFVAAMDFRGMSFVSALRQCLQRFRLPGEGQVIDRYMQAFARKYYEDNSVESVHPDFASAEAAWVLAMSVMMLNTDLHAQALRRRRMTDDQFLRNNKGMNDGVDFRGDMLLDIYNEIKNSEIKLDSEQAEVSIKTDTYDVASGALASRAVEHLKTVPTLEFTDYYNASHAAHIRPMFEQCWLAILVGVSDPFSQLTDPVAVTTCIEGLELALRLSCRYDVELARVSFVQTLGQHATQGLLNYEHLNFKQLGSAEVLLRVALLESDNMKESWYEVLKLVSLIERTQLLAHDKAASPGAEALLSSAMIVNSDRVFANTQAMTDKGALYFVRALSRISLEEIEESKNNMEPRLFALQKLVDVCYYNSARIRMGWSALWDTAMTEQFAKVLVYPNDRVVALAIDSLRQLSMRLLEQDEMPHFAFQQEFLSPFVHVLRFNNSTSIKVLALECLTQIVVTRFSKLKSGWRSIFDAVEAPALQSDERRPNENGQSPDSIKVVLGAAYSLLAAVSVESKIPPGFIDACEAVARQPEARTALKAVELLHRLVDARLGDLPVCLAVLKALGSTATSGRDLEARGRALEVLFDVLMVHGSSFSGKAWDDILDSSLYPLFSVLNDSERPGEDLVGSRRDENKREEVSLWLSSTLIQALKSTVSLFTAHFDQLQHALDVFFLELLETCILQDNDAVARMGNSCLQQLIHDNATKFQSTHWHVIATRLVKLFKVTTASKLLSREVLDDASVDGAQVFKNMIAKTVQTLLVIETVRFLLVGSTTVFSAMPMPEILRVLTRLQNAYNFARSFNHQLDLRLELFKRGFFKQTPNLLLQESVAAQTYVSAAMRLFKSRERFELDPAARNDISEELIPLCVQALSDFRQLQQAESRYIVKIAPVAESVLRHVASFDEEDFAEFGGGFYFLAVDIVGRELPPKLRVEIQAFLRRFGEFVLLNKDSPGEKDTSTDKQRAEE